MRRFALLAGLSSLAAACPAKPPSSGTETTVEPLPPVVYPDTGESEPATRPPDTNPDNAMRLHAIDIGQGDAILLEFPCGAVLVDTGGEDNPYWDGVEALRAYLDQFFARRPDLDRTLELLVVTHPHIDHDRGVQMVLETYTVNNIVDNGTEIHEIGGEEQIAMHAWISERGDAVGHRVILASDVVPPRGLTDHVIDPIMGCGRSAVDPKIVALWGRVTEDLPSYGEDPNLHSIVLRVDFGESSALLSGDLETLGIARMFKKFEANPEIFDVDIYKVGHHGSRNATTHYQLEAMSPQVAVISMGPYDRKYEFTARQFGHPHYQTIDMLTHRDHGVRGRRPPKRVPVGLRGAWKERPSEFEVREISHAIYATGWDGTVVVDANANGWIEVDTER